ncbi:MAG: class II aldolase/adducin family protein [Candidatus Saccharimonadaceae bacterium]
MSKKDGSIIGLYKTSSEYPFHKSITEVRPELNSLIHPPPTAIVAFSIVHLVPNTKIDPQSHRICGDIRFAPNGTPGPSV